MQKQNPVSAIPAGTQGGAYTSAELEIIAELAVDGYTREEVAELFPHRTFGAVKNRIIDMRHELGLIAEKARPYNRCDSGPGMLDPNDEGARDEWWPQHCAAMRQGSATLLAALRAS